MLSQFLKKLVALHFLSQLAENAGYDLDFTAVDPDELMIATIYAAQGIEAPLQQAFEKIVQNVE